MTRWLYQTICQQHVLGQSVGLCCEWTDFEARGISPVGLSPRPFSTVPLVFRSIFQLSVSPALFLRVKAKTALPCFIASFRSASEDWRELLMISNASDEGNASMTVMSNLSWMLETRGRLSWPFLRDIVVRLKEVLQQVWLARGLKTGQNGEDEGFLDGRQRAVRGEWKGMYIN